MPTYRNVIAADDPYMHWTLDGTWADAEGVAATDGAALAGSIFPTDTTSDVLNTTNWKYFASGTDTSVRLSGATAGSMFNTALDDNNALTIEFWVKLDSTGFQYIIYGDTLFSYVNGGTITAYVAKSVGDVQVTTGTTLSTGVLYHLMFVWDGTTFKVYLNGVLDGTATSAGTLNLASNTVMSLGANSGAGAQLKGYLGQLAIYRAPLSAGQAAAHYAAGTSGSSAVTYISSTTAGVASSTSTNMAITLPSFRVDSYLLLNVLHLSDSASYGTITAPTGWTLLTSNTASSGYETPRDVFIYYRVVDGGESSTSTWTRSTTGSLCWSMTCYMLSGVNNPADITLAAAAGSSSTDRAYRSKSTAAGGLYIGTVSMSTYGTGSMTYTAPTGVTSVSNQGYASAAGSTAFVRVAHVLTSTSSPTTGPFSFTANNGNTPYYSTLEVPVGAAATHATVNAVVSDTDVAGQPATVSTTSVAHVTVNAAVTGVAVAAHPATIATESGASVSAVVTNTSVLGHAATVSTSSTSGVTVNAEVTALTLDALDVTLEVDGDPDITIVAAATNLNVFGKVAQIDKGPQILAPTSASNLGIYSSWRDHNASTAGADLTNAVDETSPDDNDYVTSTMSASGEAHVAFSFVASAPGPGTKYLRYRLAKDVTHLSNTARLIVSVTDGQGYSQEWTHTSAQAFTTVTQTLTIPSTADYANLRVNFRHLGFKAMAPSDVVRVSWVQLEFPAAPIIVNYEGNPTVTNVGIAGTTAGMGSSSTASVADIDVKMKNVSVLLPGQVQIGADVASIGVDSPDVTFSNARSYQALAIPTNVGVTAGAATRVRTADNSFRFIPITDNSYTAVDADSLESVDLGALLHGQQKYFAFKMGNVGPEPINLVLSIQSVNTDLAAAGTLSSDKVTYSGTITVESIPSNGVSDPIWVKLDSGSINPGEGSFVINVEQFDA